MRIVYYSYWGTYAAYLAAALHTGTYPEHIPSMDKLNRQLELCKRYSSQFGNFLYIGLDKDFREIYSLGCKDDNAMVHRAIKGINSIYGVEEPICFIRTNHIEGSMPYYMETMGRLIGEDLLFKNAFHYWIKKRYNTCKDFVIKAKGDLKGN